MSQQKDGFLNTMQSYNFNREVTGNYKVNPIESGRFADWQKDHMYRSTYSQYHSKVFLVSYLGLNLAKSIIHS
jgi:hypothetical protein